MNKSLLHTPEGVRDVYGEEYARKLFVEKKLHDTIHLYGYQDIQTPTFEFLMFTVRRSARRRLPSCINFSIRKAIPWRFVRTLRRPVPDAPQNISWMRPHRFVLPTAEARLRIRRTYRAN